MSVRSDPLRAWMSAVTAISRTVNAAEPLETVLDDIAQMGCDLVGFDYCGVMLDDVTHEVMQIAGSSGLRKRYLDLVRSEGWLEIHPTDFSADLPATKAYRELTTIVVPDVYAENNERLHRFAAAQGYRSVLTAPLRVGNDDVGILAGYFRDPHDYEPEEIELAELLAEQSANAIRTAQLRAAQQATINDLSAVNDELRRRRASLDWADQQHRRLMRLVLNDIGMDGLVAALADMLQASATVLDSAERVLAAASAGEHTEPPKLDRKVRSQWEGTDRYEAVLIEGRDAETWLIPIVLSGEVVGWLWVIREPSEPDAGRQRLIEHFALVVGLEILKQRHIVEVQERLCGDLMVDLLRASDVPPSPMLIQRAEALGHDLTTPHWLAVFAGEFGPKLDQVALTVRGTAPRHEILVGIYANSVVMLVSCDRDPLPIVQRALTRVRESSETDRVAVALSPPVERLADYPVNYQTGVRTTQLRLAADAGGLVDLRRVPLTSLLLLNSTVPDQLRRFAEGLIEPLESHDEQRETDLVDTLRTWLAEGFSAAATGSRMTIHVNTVGYRLAKIHTLLGLDLRKAEVRLELQLAVTVWDIMRGEQA
ncbi:helix-turn-helix domain-containing protein [Mycolicibacterium smegmatis]|uniref:GAF domain protein n=1 Tax=Mycolicibacterium smegmatis (strain MKD8) TaxID=1214915 RepID=A0A2U9PTD8_MYCSE|nr:helix-turn-helix domain-containing protein [Mycolicibacterium smegmatis]AWT55004.1 GAF domain protein [Mycolicibacterium smegmatis MKD8]